MISKRRNEEGERSRLRERKREVEVFDEHSIVERRKLDKRRPVAMRPRKERGSDQDLAGMGDGEAVPHAERKRKLTLITTLVFRGPSLSSLVETPRPEASSPLFPSAAAPPLATSAEVFLLPPASSPPLPPFTSPWTCSSTPSPATSSLGRLRSKARGVVARLLLASGTSDGDAIEEGTILLASPRGSSASKPSPAPPVDSSSAP